MKNVCTVCGWVYDEGEAGVKWEDLPEDFTCELCGAGKAEFSPEEKEVKTGTGGRKASRFLGAYVGTDASAARSVGRRTRSRGTGICTAEDRGLGDGPVQTDRPASSASTWSRFSYRTQPPAWSSARISPLLSAVNRGECMASRREVLRTFTSE